MGFAGIVLAWLADGGNGALRDDDIGWIDFAGTDIDKLPAAQDEITCFFPTRYTNPSRNAHEATSSRTLDSGFGRKYTLFTPGMEQNSTRWNRDARHPYASR